MRVQLPLEAKSIQRRYSCCWQRCASFNKRRWSLDGGDEAALLMLLW